MLVVWLAVMGCVSAGDDFALAARGGWATQGFIAVARYTFFPSSDAALQAWSANFNTLRIRPWRSRRQ